MAKAQPTIKLRQTTKSMPLGKTMKIASSELTGARRLPTVSKGGDTKPNKDRQVLQSRRGKSSF